MPHSERIQALEAYSLDFKRKRTLMLIAFGIRNFLRGIQYSIILPSAWQYLRRFGISATFYGAVISMYQVSFLLSAPILGRLYDNTKKTKQIFTLMNFFEFAGCILYAIPYSKWLPLTGRFISGLGAIGSPVVDSELAWITKESDRMKTFANVQLGFFVGIFLGPPVSLLFKEFNFSIGIWRIDYANAPGFFGGLTWLFMEILNQLMVHNLAKDYVDTESDGKILIDTDEDSGHMLSTDDGNTNPYIKSKVTLQECLMEVGSVEILGILFSTFTTWLLIFVGETLLTLLGQGDLGWSIVDTSIGFLLGAAWHAVVYLILGCFDNVISDNVCILVAEIGAIISAICLLVYEATRGNHPASFAMLSCTLLLAFGVEPLNYVGSKSLLSKVTPIKMQGVIQASLAMFMTFANIIGPLYGSVAYHHLGLCSVIIIELCVVSVIWLIVSRQRLIEREIKYDKNGN